jgi:hypothetical protein
LREIRKKTNHYSSEDLEKLLVKLKKKKKNKGKSTRGETKVLVNEVQSSISTLEYFVSHPAITPSD